MMPHPDLRLVSSFVAVADCGSFSAAARRLHLSQSAVSRQVGELERQVDCLLLRRTGRGVVVTEQGGRFLGEARRILGDLAAAANALHQPLPPGLRVAAVSGPLSYWLPEVLARFTAETRERLQVTDARAEEIADGLAAGQLDVGICNLPVRRGLQSLPLLSEALVAVVAPSHPLAARAAITLDELRGETFILVPPGQHLHLAAVGACQAAGWQPQVGYLAGSSQLCCELVAAGLGVSIVPSMCALRHGPRIRSLELAPPWRRTLGAVYLRETPGVRRFLRFLQGSLPAGGGLAGVR